MTKYKVLFVCTGNICRSPSADGILRHKLAEENLDHLIETDSVGTHSYHVGEPPTPTGLNLAAKRGYDYADLRARQLNQNDFNEFDLILAMDHGHLDIIQNNCPERHLPKVAMFLDFCDQVSKEVNDPYYGGPSDYEAMLDVIETGVNGLIAHLRQVINE
ncbi:low molecular weight protein-tyrosine-phosphatase [Kiloniella sp.]|uniref:low molecular weight protein-tyrosine-phosphatase n=1 Tax=Kiloniella sp. TaxID=1938587 RepID=UPI003B02C83A